jgi:hypothetical protein
MDGNVFWSMETERNAKGSKGFSESSTDTGNKIVNFAVSFDGEPAQNLSFIENTDGLSDQNFIQYDYAFTIVF